MNWIKSIKIKNFSFPGNVFIAPLANITDKAFRMIIRKYKPGFMFAEMINVNGLVRGNLNLEKFIKEDEFTDTGIQLIGNDENLYREVAQELEDKKVKWIDVNLGCSIPKILKQKIGGYLLNEPKKIEKIIKTLRENFSGILSMKIRAGIDENNLNYRQISQIGFEEGIDVLFFHARTVKQQFRGTANWNWIKDLKESFPERTIFGNGDIFTPEDAINKITYSKCDGILLARGIMKRPWLLKQIYDYAFTKKYSKIEKWEIFKLLCEHLKWKIKFYGEEKSMKEIRKFVGWYFSEIKGVRKIRKLLPELNKEEDINKIKRILEEL